MPDRVDIAIVGAGIAGLATAHALTRDRAASVAIFDLSWPGSGDSGRSFSMVRRHYSNPVVARLAMAGSRTIMNWEDEVGVADAGFVRCGYLLTVPERLVDACRGNVQMLAGLGLDTRYLERGEIPDVEPELSLEGVAGAAHEPDGGFADAQKMCLGWFTAAASRGLRHHLGTRVRRLVADGDRVSGVETDEGVVGAERVVVATGAWANDLLAPLGAVVPIELRRLQVAVLRTRAGGPLPSAVVSDAVTNVVVRPDRGHRFCAVAYAGEDVLERADDCDHGLTDGYLDAVRAGLEQRYPRLADFELVRGFAGPYDVTPDWNPVIGPCPGVEGLYLATGWSGHGFKLSPAVGEVVAAEVTGRTPPIDVTELRAERFAEGRLLRLAYGPGARA
ncbi:MAG TPA: FAD-binding oxidoreductase [Gaiellales bacterium]|nr:FAD-binding oxidoreductase [Gaiellales bacterium]